MLDRRALIFSIASVLIASSLDVGAQRTEKVAHIGMLCTTRCVGPAIDALRDGLRSAGWVEGGNLHIEYRAAGWYCRSRACLRSTMARVGL